MVEEDHYCDTLRGRQIFGLIAADVGHDSRSMDWYVSVVDDQDAPHLKEGGVANRWCR